MSRILVILYLAFQAYSHALYAESSFIERKQSQSIWYPTGGRVSVHGFILMPREKSGSVWISHKPMFGVTHDFQLAFRATITNSTVHPLSIPTNVDVLNHQWNIEPEQWSLNDFLIGTFDSFEAKLYRGNFERNGTYLGNITIEVTRPFLTIVPLDASATDHIEPIRYTSYALSDNNRITVGSSIHLYLLHQIQASPDFDTIAHATVRLDSCVTRLQREQLGHVLLTSASLWAFPEVLNKVTHRLSRHSGTVRAELMDGPDAAICMMQIVEEIQCTAGPDFYDDCVDIDPVANHGPLFMWTRYYSWLLIFLLSVFDY